MKKIILLSSIFLLQSLSAQYTKSELAKHRRAVEQSLSKAMTIISLDTIFEKGNPVGLAKIGGENNISIRNLEDKELVFIRKAERKDRSLYTFNGNLTTVLQHEIRGEYWGEMAKYPQILLEKGVILNGQLMEKPLGNFIKENAIFSAAVQSHLNNIDESTKSGRVVVSMDTIFNKGERYGIIKKVGSDGVSIRNLADKELIYLKKESFKGVDDLVFNTNGQFYLTFVFLGLQKQAEVDNSNVFSGLRNHAEMVINAGLIQNGELDTAAVDRFVQAHGTKFSEKRERGEISTILGNATNGDNKSTQPSNVSAKGYVERNKNAAISLNYDKIEQDFKVIGMVKRSVGMSMTGNKINVIAFSFPNAVGVAEAQAELSNDTKWNVMTPKDGKQHTLTIQIKGMEVEEIARFLILNNYL